MEVQVWKVKNNNEILMGSFSVEGGELLEEVGEVEKDMIKRVNMKEIWNGFVKLRVCVLRRA